ncbi:hypothetical protein JW911_03385 [Candidatus Peregrinibacteria bacterium]|nr:hypothetical protein [Candidatus Peregrinibacteria bacterium]
MKNKHLYNQFKYSKLVFESAPALPPEEQGLPDERIPTTNYIVPEGAVQDYIRNRVGQVIQGGVTENRVNDAVNKNSEALNRRISELENTNRELSDRINILARNIETINRERAAEALTIQRFIDNTDNAIQEDRARLTALEARGAGAGLDLTKLTPEQRKTLSTLIDDEFKTAVSNVEAIDKDPSRANTATVFERFLANLNNTGKTLDIHIKNTDNSINEQLRLNKEFDDRINIVARNIQNLKEAGIDFGALSEEQKKKLIELIQQNAKAGILDLGNLTDDDRKKLVETLIHEGKLDETIEAHLQLTKNEVARLKNAGITPEEKAKLEQQILNAQKDIQSLNTKRESELDRLDEINAETQALREKAIEHDNKIGTLEQRPTGPVAPAARVRARRVRKAILPPVAATPEAATEQPPAAPAVIPLGAPEPTLPVTPVVPPASETPAPASAPRTRTRTPRKPRTTPAPVTAPAPTAPEAPVAPTLPAEAPKPTPRQRKRPAAKSAVPPAAVPATTPDKTPVSAVKPPPAPVIPKAPSTQKRPARQRKTSVPASPPAPMIPKAAPTQKRTPRAKKTPVAPSSVPQSPAKALTRPGRAPKETSDLDKTETENLKRRLLKGLILTETRLKNAKITDTTTKNKLLHKCKCLKGRLTSHTVLVAPQRKGLTTTYNNLKREINNAIRQQKPPAIEDFGRKTTEVPGPKAKKIPYTQATDIGEFMKQPPAPIRPKKTPETARTITGFQKAQPAEVKPKARRTRKAPATKPEAKPISSPARRRSPRKKTP